MGGSRWALALALALVPASVPAQAAEDDLSALTQRLNALDSWIDEAGARLAGHQEQVAATDRDIAASATRIRGLDERIRVIARQLAQARDEGRRLTGERARQETRLAAYLRDAWRGAGRDPLRQILNGEDRAWSARMLRYQGYLARAGADAIDKLRATASGVAVNRQRLEARQGQLEAARRAASEARAALVGKRESGRQAVAGLRSELARKGKERERLAADRERLRQLVARLETRASPAPAADQLGKAAHGVLAWPVDGRLTRRFGQARAGGRMRWEGIYLQAPLGAEVRAVAGGRVVFGDWLRGFGMLLIIDHGAGRLSLYGHADALFKRVGDHVEAGEAIAAVGKSGGQQETGLYLEVRQGGQAIDPLGWLRELRAP